MRILITGGDGSIAQAIARALSSEHQCLTPNSLKLDVTNWDDVINYMKTYQPDILINCAGYIKPASVKASEPYDWVKQVQVNLMGTYYCSKEALRRGAKTIINISSSSGFKGRKFWSAYCASKAGVISLTQSMAEEGIDAYCISPHRTDTRMRAALFPGENKEDLMHPSRIAAVVKSIIAGEYKKGDNIEVSKDEIIIRN